MDYNRRKLLKDAGVAAIGLSAGTSAWLKPARAAAESIVAVTWGGPHVKANQAAADDFTKTTGIDVVWELHEGASTNILSKIKAMWPTVRHDLVQATDPVFYSMMKEDGWLADVDDVEGMADVHPKMVDTFRDANGKAKVVPVLIGTTYYGYRTDMVSSPIRKMEDLLDPSLKGKIGILDPSLYTCLPYVAMALEFGGSEHNMEPGWEFLKKLAESGNVGQVLKSDVDTINALTTGSIAVAYTGIGNWGKISKSVPTTLCNRMPESKGMKAFLFTLGWAITNGPRTAEAKRFASFLLKPEHNQQYAADVTASPANSKAKAAPELENLLISTAEDIDRYGYFPDFPYITSQMESWTQRFETEIMPIIRGR